MPTEYHLHGVLTLHILFHIDATQSCGKLVDEIRKLKYSMLSFSARKMGGPQGVGVLVLRRKNYKLPPIKKQIRFAASANAGDYFHLAIPHKRDDFLQITIPLYYHA